MVSPGYILQQFRAVLAMAQDNPKWKSLIDADADGFYRSFWALALCLPLVIVTMHMTRGMFSRLVLAEAGSPEPVELSLVYLSGLQLLVSVLIWAASITMLITVARGAKAERGIAPLIVGHNWAELMTQLVTMVILFAVVMTPDPSFFVGLLLGAQIFAIYLRWGVIRRGIGGNVIQSIAVLVMLYLVAFVVNMLVSALGLFIGSLFV